MYVVLEYCDGGDFSKFLKKHKRISEHQARYFLRQLGKAAFFRSTCMGFLILLLVAYNAQLTV